MKCTNKKSIPERTRPGLKTFALIAGNSQGDGAQIFCAKTATGDQNIKMLKMTTWNVRNLHATGKLKELTHELEEYR